MFILEKSFFYIRFRFLWEDLVALLISFLHASQNIFFVHRIVNGIFYLLELLLFSLVSNSFGYLLQAGRCLLRFFSIFRLYLKLQFGQLSTVIALFHSNVFLLVEKLYFFELIIFM